MKVQAASSITTSPTDSDGSTSASKTSTVRQVEVARDMDDGETFGRLGRQAQLRIPHRRERS